MIHLILGIGILANGLTDFIILYLLGKKANK